MTFKNIDQLFWFLALIPIGVLMIIGHKKRKNRLSSTISKELWKIIIPSLNYSRRFWKQTIRIVALILILISLLRPQYGIIFEQVERKGQDIYIALDLSNSMLASDIAPSRLEHAKREILSLIDELKGDRIGLIAFAGNAFIQCPLTTDYSALKMFLRHLNPGIMSTPGTDIATAIKTARLSFERVSKNNKPILIIISDGESFENDPIKSAEVAHKKGIVIYTLGIGSENGDPIPIFNDKNQLKGYKKDKSGEIILSKLNQSVLKEIAITTKGNYFNSNLGAFVIDKIYKEISLNEKKQLEDTLLKLHIDRYQWFLAIGFILLLLERIINDRKKHKPNDYIIARN
jgi:Ca-activated chloride channel homolog